MKLSNEEDHICRICLCAKSTLRVRINAISQCLHRDQDYVCKHMHITRKSVTSVVFAFIEGDKFSISCILWNSSLRPTPQRTSCRGCSGTLLQHLIGSRGIPSCPGALRKTNLPAFSCSGLPKLAQHRDGPWSAFIRWHNNILSGLQLRIQLHPHHHLPASHYFTAD